jgi:sugar phosphate isomerase/epimerase
MKTPPFLERLAVCSWSLQPQGPQHLLDQLKALGISRVQIALDPLRTEPAAWEKFPQLCAQRGIQLVSGMFGTVGEDYSTMDSIRRTGGVVPDATWEENRRNLPVIAELARKLNLSLVTFHAGFLPHEETDPAFAKLIERIRWVADLFAGKGLELGFETGQESAATLLAFLKKLERPSVGVNFDPANMILYDKGDPIEALQILAPRLKQCHLKDAVKTRTPGAWGEEVPLGTGEVDWPRFFKTLQKINFSGYLSIEREAGSQRLQDILTARKFVEGLIRAEG